MTEQGGAGLVVIVGAETMGRGDDALGAKLMGSFLRTLSSVGPRPDAIVFYNAAVKMLGPGSPQLDALRALADAGVDLLACVTCLEFYALAQALEVGAVSNMREIVQLTLRASKTVTV